MVEEEDPRERSWCISPSPQDAIFPPQWDATEEALLEKTWWKNPYPPWGTQSISAMCPEPQNTWEKPRQGTFWCSMVAALSPKWRLHWSSWNFQQQLGKQPEPLNHLGLPGHACGPERAPHYGIRTRRKAWVLSLLSDFRSACLWFYQCCQLS